MNGNHDRTPILWKINPENFKIDRLSVPEVISNQINLFGIQLDWSLLSLKRLSTESSRKKLLENLNKKLFFHFSLYFGEVIRDNLNAKWDLRRLPEDDNYWEPWIIVEDAIFGTASFLPHESVYIWMKSEDSRDLLSYAEEIIHRLSFSSSAAAKRVKNELKDSTCPDSVSVMEAIARVQGANVAAERLFKIVGSHASLITPEVIAIADNWILSAIQYFLAFGFFEQFEGRTLGHIKLQLFSFKERMEEIAPLDPFERIGIIERSNITSFYMELVEVSFLSSDIFKEYYRSRLLSSSILMTDMSRVWTSYEIEKYSQGEIHILERWSEISRGSFHVDLVESSASFHGCKTHRIAINDTVLDFSKEDFDPTLDLPAINKINTILHQNNEQFSFSISRLFIGGGIGVMAFSSEERCRLNKDKAL